MRLRLPPDETARIISALRRGGAREVGGQLFGEQLAPSDFRATRVTVQPQRGTVTRFVVDAWQAAREAVSFFRATGHAYRRFNSIGDWHSHPLFPVTPSGEDLATMRSLVAAADFRGSFAVMMIVRLDGGRLTAGAWLFDPQGAEFPIELEFEA